MSTTTATTVIRRTTHLHRYLHRVNHHLLRRSYFTSPPSPSQSPLPNLPHSSPLLNKVNLQGQEVKSFGLYDRYFCTSTASQSSGGGGSKTKSEEEVKSLSAEEVKSLSAEEVKSLSAEEVKSSSEEEAKSSSEEAAKSSSSSDDGGNSQGSQQSGNAGRSVRGSPVSWVSLLLLLVTGAGILYYYDREKKRHIEEINNASTVVRQGPSVGQAAIGGPFKLINHEGKNVTEKDFLGKWTVMYFGFTHCPDICPDELEKLAKAVDEIKKKSGIEIVPVFISVDPERDTVEQVSDYIKEFHPKLIGLTGDPEEIRKVARAYRVYYMKTTEEGSDYLVDHSIVMYLMSPQMEFVKFYGKNNDVDGLVNGIIKEVKQYKK